MDQKSSQSEILKKAILAFNEGELKASKRLFTSVLKTDPSNISANHGIALILLKVGKQKEALSFLSFCIQSDPVNILYLKEYINTLVVSGEINKARNKFQQLKHNYEENDKLLSLALELNPENNLDFYYGYLKNIGIFSVKKGEIIKVKSNPMPLLTNSFLSWFETQSWNNKNLLELGSGSSTLYFAKYFKYLTSIETNHDWYHKLLPEIKKSVNLKKKDLILSSLEDEKINAFDVVLIDAAENRARIARYLAINKFEGIIFFDNAEKYRNSIRILEEAGFSEIPFFGIKPTQDWVSCTSVLIRDKDMSKIFKSDWIKVPKFSSLDLSNRWDKE